MNMKNYVFKVLHCMGYCHSGAVCTEDYVNVELTDSEEHELVKLAQEKGRYIHRFDLEEEAPEVYKDLDETFREVATVAVEYHCLSEEFEMKKWERSFSDDLVEFCKNELGFVFEFEFDEADYLDKDGVLDKEALEQDREEEEKSVFAEWLADYMDGLSTKEFCQFMYDHMGYEPETVEDYEVVLSDEFMAMAKL